MIELDVRDTSGATASLGRATDRAVGDVHRTGWIRSLALPPPIAARVATGTTPIVITGAGGWLGQATLAMLAETLGPAVFAERVRAYGSDDRVQALPAGGAVRVERLSSLAEASFGPAHYFHYAFLTKDRLLSVDPASFVAGNTAIGDLVAGAMLRNGIAGLFMPSSGAVYRRGGRTLDDDVATNPYGALKLADERRFGDIAARLDVPLCMPRVFNLAGPFINKIQIYALATMIGDVLAGRPIEIRASHRVLRSYLHVGDLLRLAAAMLFAPRPDAAACFDTAGERAVELSDLAQRVAGVLGRPATIVRPPVDSDRAPDDYIGDDACMMAQIAAYGLTRRNLDEQIRDTAAYLAWMHEPPGNR